MASLKVVLMTQNIGSIECNTPEVTSENKEKSLKWVDSVATFLSSQEKVESASSVPNQSREPEENDVVVLHLQEIGGKKRNQAFNEYLARIIPRCYPKACWCSGLLMATDNDTFTAMGTVIFLSSRAVDVTSILAFPNQTYHSIKNSKEMFMSSPAPSSPSSVRLYKNEKFSNAGKSRKGYVLTSLLVGKTTVLNFVNIHLFHDADNSISASQSFPSEYTKKRVDAFSEAMCDINSIMTEKKRDINDNPLFFMFGDFNARLNTHDLKKYLEEMHEETIELEKKKIVTSEKVWNYLEQPSNWPYLKENFDLETSLMSKQIMETVGMKLQEAPVNFGPTYLLVEESEDATHVLVHQSAGSTRCSEFVSKYKKQRFPAWCDRVLFNDAAASRASLAGTGSYGVIPSKRKIMDHDAVFLSFRIEIID